MNDADQSMAEPIAIVGIGCLFPKAENVGAYWANICNRVDAITDIPPTHWNPKDYLDADPKAPDHVYAARGGFLSPVDFPPLEFGITPNTLEATDTTQLLGLVAARQALEDAGYGATRSFDRNRVSVILGVTGTLELVIPLGARLGHPIWRRALREAGVADDVANQVVERIADSYVNWQEDSFPGLLGNVAAGRIANRLDLGGTNCVVDAACASSLGALHLAMLELAAGRSDMVVSGGLDTFNDIFMYMCFSKTPALSPTGNAKPFDVNGDGTILGEGLGVVVLKRRRDAIRDGDKIYALIRGIGTSSDGKGNAIYAPSPAGQAKALRQAYQQAGVTPDSIELVEAHGTGTRAGDTAEVTALGEVFRSSGRHGTWCALGSVKSQIGHTKAAAGVAGLIKAVLALHHKVLPPTIKVEKPIDPIAPGRSPFYVNTEKKPWITTSLHPRRAAVSSFGFGGSNFHCVLEEADPAKSHVDWVEPVEMLALSAHSRQELIELLSAFEDGKDWHSVQVSATESRVRFDPNANCRLVIVVERDLSNLTSIIAGAHKLLEQVGEPRAPGNTERIFFAEGPCPGKLAFLFPGQGSQYVGMLRDLACHFPRMQSSLADANVAFNSVGRLSDFIYPPTAFSNDERDRNEAELRATDHAQPALGAISFGAYRILDDFGVRPGAVAGHSYGELVALCAAEVIESNALHLLSRARGQLMQSTGNGDRGTMLAVQSPQGPLEELLQSENVNLVIANKNSPTQFVLSGSTANVARAEDILASHKISCRRLPVAAAFHSPLVAAAQTAFRATLGPIDFRPASIPVYSNTTGNLYPREPEASRTILARQLAEPVEFVAQIENLYESGVRTFLEVGPNNKLTGLVRSILENRPHAAVALDASAGRRSGFVDLACLLAQLAVHGHPVDLQVWQKTEAHKQIVQKEKKPTMTVSLCGANYVNPKSARRNETKPPADARVAAVRTPNEPPASLASSRIQAVLSKETAAPKSIPLAGARQSLESRVAEPMPDVKPPVPTSLAPASSSTFSQALQITQENLLALQKLGEQTAALHRQFLDGQDKVLDVFQSLLNQQQQLIQTGLGQPVQSAASHASSKKIVLPAPVNPAAAAVEKSPPIAAVPVFAPQPSEPRIASVPTIPQAAPKPTTNANTAKFDNTGFAATLLGVVAEKTGYPTEMLELDMELDADLGIDSIKRVEIFSSLQEQLPHAPAIKPEHLGSLRTLRHVLDFVAGVPEDIHSTQPVSRTKSPINVSATSPLVESASSLLLEVVAEKTGYPADMLNLDMELDADLGIDSIKRVEIFSTLQERLPNAPVIKPEHLGTLRTLREVSDFLDNSATTIEVAVAESTGTQAENPASKPLVNPSSGNGLQRWILKPKPRDNDQNRTEISFAPSSLIWITEDDSGVAASIASKLELQGHRTLLMPWTSTETCDVPSHLNGLVIIAPRSGIDERFMCAAFQLVQRCAGALRRAGNDQSAVLITVSRMDGAFGFEHAQGDAISGGLAGLAKTAAREWPEVHCKAIDLAVDEVDGDESALAIAEEMLLRGPIEVGISQAGRVYIDMIETPAPQAGLAKPFSRGDVVVITGGARGVTAEVAIALAKQYAPILILLGRSPAPQTEPNWLTSLDDESSIKRVLSANANGKASPRRIEEEYRAILANREIRNTLQRIETAGAKATYYSVDVSDASVVQKVFTEVRHRFGPIRGLIHGAGVIADRLIEDKALAQFEKVYRTKVGGFQACLDSLELGDLKLLVAFSSTTARLGRVGQVDYAMSNEVLNKLAQQHARRLPGCRVLSVNWGPWEGGMVTPSLQSIFRKEGVGLIPLAEGAQFLIGEIESSVCEDVEIIVMGQPSLNVESPNAAPVFVKSRVSEDVAEGQSLAFEHTLSVEQFPILQSHVLDGYAVLPMALTVEWLAHAALHANPGLVFRGFEDLRILKGVRLESDESKLLRVYTGKATQGDSGYRIPIEMRHEEAGRASVIHARASIILNDGLPTPSKTRLEVPATAYQAHIAEMYQNVLFHGRELQGIERVDRLSSQGFRGWVTTAPAPSAWIRKPLRNTWLADPLVLDSAFQLMILWCQEIHGTRSLPCHAGRYQQFRRSFPNDGVQVIANITRQSPQRVLADIEFQDNAGALLARIEDYECVLDAALERAFRNNQLPTAGAHSR